MAKRLFFVSAAILMFAIAYHLGATNAQGQSPTSVRFVGMYTYGPYVAALGKVWLLNGDHWQPMPTDLPVPIDQVVAYCMPDGYTANIVTTSGEGFQSNGNGPWVSRGFIPGGPIAVQPETWTGVKTKYR